MARPIVKDAGSCIFDEMSTQAVESISLSNNTVSRRIVDIAKDIENELISQLYTFDACALRMDESTYVAGKTILFVFVRYDRRKKYDYF